MTNVVPFQGMQVPAYMQQAGLSKEQIAAMNAGAVAGTGGGGINKISLKQSRFRLVVGGTETMIIPQLAINVVAVRVSDTIAKAFYEKEWNPNDEPQNPDCYSDDGIRPRPDSLKPQHTDCANCPQNQWGSKINRVTGGKIKACTDTKRMALVAPDNTGRFAGGGDLYQLSVPPASLAEWGTFVRQMASLPTPVAYNAVVIELSFDPTVSYPKLLFKPVRYLEQDEYMEIAGRYDKEETKRVAGLAEAQVMRSGAPAQLAGPAPTAQIPMQPQVQQPVQQPVQTQPQVMPQVQPQVDPNAGGWGGAQPAPVQAQPQVQQPVQAQPQVDAGGWGQPGPAAVQAQPQVQPQADAGGWGQPQTAPQEQPAPVQQQVQQPVVQAQPQVQHPAPGTVVNGVVIMSNGRPYGKASEGRARRTKAEMEEDNAYDIARGAAQAPQQVPVTPVQQVVQQAQQAPVQAQPQADASGWGQPQAAPQQAPVQAQPQVQPQVDAGGWGQPQTAPQAQPQAAPAFDPNNPFAGAPGAQPTGAPNQPGVVGGADLNAVFAGGWDDQPAGQQ